MAANRKWGLTQIDTNSTQCRPVLDVRLYRDTKSDTDKEIDTNLRRLISLLTNIYCVECCSPGGAILDFSERIAAFGMFCQCHIDM